MSSFNKLPKRTDQSLDMDAWVNINRQAKKLNNIQFDPYDFQVSNDATGIFVALNEQTGSGSTIDNTNFRIDQVDTNTTSGETTFEVHGGRLYFASNGATKILEGDPAFFGGNFFDYWSNVYSANTTSDGFICAKIDSNTNPTNYTIEIKALPYSTPPSPPDYFPLGYVNIATNTDSAYITQLMIGDVTWANVSGNTSSVALDNVSVNTNSAGKVQVYGFENAVNTSSACSSTDVFPYKSTDNPGETINWCTVQDVVNVACQTIDCSYINQCVTANSVSVFCTTINSVGGSDCLCDWLAANPTCVPQKTHTNLDFTGSVYGRAGNNVDHSACYWQRGAYGSGNSTYSQNYGSSIGNSSAVKLIDIDNCYLNSNATATTLNWANKELLSGAATLNWGNKQLLGDWATTGKHTATEFDVASSETKLSNVSLVLQNSYAPIANQWSASNFEVRSSGDAYIKSTGTTTVYSANVYTQATSSLITASSGTLTSDSSTTTIITAGTKLTLQAITDPVLIKTYSSKPIDLVPSGDLTINGTPGKTITSVSTKGILTGNSLQEYLITANVGGTTTTFYVLGRP
jgi:hypothetical protein